MLRASVEHIALFLASAPLACGGSTTTERAVPAASLSVDAGEPAARDAVNSGDAACAIPPEYAVPLEPTAVGCVEQVPETCASGSFGLYCIGVPNSDAGIPAPDPSLACSVEPQPAPENVLYWCCTCS